MEKHINLQDKKLYISNKNKQHLTQSYDIYNLSSEC